jgi:penicillin-binding protein 1A
MNARLARVLTFALWAAVAGILLGALGGWIIAQSLHVPQVDQLATFRPATTTHIFAGDGEQVASFALERRVELRPEQIPDHVKHAIVAIEDADFYDHGGVDPSAVLRAALVTLRNVVSGSDRVITQGGSTLTQQLALNLFLKRERTISRKVKEALLAIDIEKRYSKDQIITMYANQIFFGHGAYGVEAASLLYYDKPASELTLPEAALLAGMIPSANNRYNPFKRPQAALQRRNKVLDRMLELGFIDREAYDSAVEQPLGVELHRDRIDSGASFLEMVRQEMEQRYGTDALYTAGLQVHLTMDRDLQDLAERSVREGLVTLEMENIGFRPPPNVIDQGLAASPAEYEDSSWRQLVLQPGAMVRAVVHEVSRREAQLRIGDFPARLTLAGAAWTKVGSLGRILVPGDLVLVRLPDPLPTPEEAGGDGEAQNPPLQVELLQEPEIEGALIAIDNNTGAILAMVGGFDFERSEFNRAVQSALQCGSAFKPFVYMTAFQQGYTPSDQLFDGPFLLPDAEGQLTYCPKNYYDRYYGITTLRRALEASYNATAVKLQQLVSGEAVVDTAKRFGITTELHPYASLALGSFEVRLIDLVRAYSGIANLGELPELYFISEIYDRDGRLEERFFPRTERVMPAPVTYLMLHLLRGVIQEGTGVSAASLEANLAGKTGTTDLYSDAWFVGFSPRITVGVWVGRDLKAPIAKRMTGARAAQPIWNRFMADYLDTVDEEVKAEDFSVPPGVVFSPVDRITGERAIPRCAHHDKIILEAFLDGTEPTEACGDRLPGLEQLPWPFQLPFYEPRPGEPMPNGEAVNVADERLRPTPTPDQLKAMGGEEEFEKVKEERRFPYPDGSFSTGR